jgi:hypothetical protein
VPFLSSNQSRPLTAGPTAELLYIRLSGGRTWWAHFEFTPVNTTPTILRKKSEDLREARHIAERYGVPRGFRLLTPTIRHSPVGTA